MSDIVETLREVENYPDKVVRERILIAAGEIERLRGIVAELAKEATAACKEHLEAEKDCIRLYEENKKIREALNPFSKALDDYGAEAPNDYIVDSDHFTIGDLRAARKVLENDNE